MAATFHVYVERDKDGSRITFRGGLDPLFENPAVEVSYLPALDREELRPGDLAGADGFVSRAAAVTADTLAGLDDLQVVARSGAGYDNLDVDALTARGVVATHAPQGPTESVAQATLSLLITCAQNLRAYERTFDRHGYSEARRVEFGHELASLTLGVLGMGRIGRRLVELLEPFGTAVQAYDPYVADECAEALGVRLVDLGELLRTSDLVSIHVPLTDETRGMLGMEEFRRMKDTAYLLNASRGGIYPDEELARAIRAGQLAGAAIDVYEDEPAVEDNPLLALEECITLPHVAGRTHESYVRTGTIVAEAMLAVKDGEIPDNVLNPAVYDREVPAEKRSPSYH